ncbi:MAG: hypothetical protein ACRYFX_12450 [Janthinobacterium lividum]
MALSWLAVLARTTSAVALVLVLAAPEVGRWHILIGASIYLGAYYQNRRAAARA